MKIKKPKKPQKIKFVFNFCIEEIKKQNLFFKIIYKERNQENNADTLNWSEIEKPKNQEIEIVRTYVLKNNKIMCSLYKKESTKLIKLLDFYNNKGLIFNEIKPTKTPTEKDLKFCISLYFGISPKFSIYNNILFKMYLKEIAEKRFFLEKIKNLKEKKIFEIYLQGRKSKKEISINETENNHLGVFIINKHLKTLVSEIMHDYENNLLQVQKYKKPPTQREINKKANAYLQKLGIKAKIPLRKPSKKELLKSWEKLKDDLTNELI